MNDFDAFTRKTIADIVKSVGIPGRLLSVKQKILITVPSLGEVDRKVAAKLFELKADDRFDVDVRFPTASPSEACRAHALLEFLGGEFDYWLSMDSDNPPAGNPLDLVDNDFDIVGCPTPVWQHGERGVSLHWNAYKDLGDGGFAPLVAGQADVDIVDAIGTGCFLAARRVFERLKDSLPFQREWKRDGTVAVGSDLNLCRKIREAGFTIRVDWRYSCDHFATVNLQEVFQLLTRTRDAARVKPGPGALARLSALAVHDEREFTPTAAPGFHAFDEMAVELETCEILYALVRAAKPKVVVETGTGRGFATLAMAEALNDNGFGDLVSFEPNEEFQAGAVELTEGYPVFIRDGDEQDQLSCNPDLVFLDSGPDRRPGEIEFWLERRVFLIIHDATRYRYCLGERGFWFKTPRGLWMEDMR